MSGKTLWLDVPPVIIIWIAAAILLTFGLKHTSAGRQLYALGGNRVRGRLSISERRYWVAVYAISGCTSALTGALLLGWSGGGFIGVGQPYLFMTLAAVVVGGTSLLGGYGGYGFTVIGVLVLQVLTSFLVGIGLKFGWQQAIVGLLILPMVALYARSPHIQVADMIRGGRTGEPERDGHDRRRRRHLLAGAVRHGGDDGTAPARNRLGVGALEAATGALRGGDAGRRSELFRRPCDVARQSDIPIVYQYAGWMVTIPMQVVALYFFVATAKTPSVALFWRLLVVAVATILARYMGDAGLMNATLAFLIGIVGWLYILGELFFGQMAEYVAKSGDRRLQQGYFWLRLIVTVGWAIYPLGNFIMSFGGGADPGGFAIAYNLADFLNRIAFGLTFLAVALKPEGAAR